MSKEEEKILVNVRKEAISVEPHEKKIELTATLLTSIEYVTVIPPPDRPDDRCCIYGHISVTDDLSKPAVTLFSRPPDDPEIVLFRNPQFRRLYLTHHDSDRALDGESHNYITLDLHEKKNIIIYEEEEEEEEENESSGLGVEEDPDGGEDQRGSEEENESSRLGEEEDPNGGEDQRGSEEENESSGLGVEEDPDGGEDQRGSEEDSDHIIADMKEVKFKGLYDYTSCIELKGNYGFGFEVRHAAVFGARVRVEVKINKAIEIETGTVKTICGRIAAWQCLGNSLHSAVIRLYSASRHDSTPVRVGERIPLDRDVVVAPLAGGWLSIGLALWCGDFKRGEFTGELLSKNKIAVDQWVHFGILSIDRLQQIFVTNEQRTHTETVLDGLFSVSITFVD